MEFADAEFDAVIETVVDVVSLDEVSDSVLVVTSTRISQYTSIYQYT